MPWRTTLRTIYLGLTIQFCLAISTYGQESTSEYWPEIDVWYRLSPEWRFSMFVPLSRNLETQYREGSLVLQADYAFGKTRVLQFRRMLDDTRAQNMKAWLARGGYLAAKSLNENGEAYQEDMAFAEMHVRTPLKGSILLSMRLRSDFRWIGDDHTFSTRLRYRTMVEKEYIADKLSLVPYVNVEPYYDSRYETINRFRFIGGGSVSWNPRYAVEANFTYQYDSKSSVTHLYAMNVIFHLYFETKRAKNQ